MLVKSNTLTFLDEHLKTIETIANFVEFHGAEDFFVFNQNNLYGVINEKGELVLPAAYQKIDQQYINNKHYFIVREDPQGYKVYDAATKSFILAGCSFIKVVSANPVLLFVQKDDATFIFDNNGSRVSAFKANDMVGLTNFENLFIFKLNDLWGLADNHGRIIQNPKWDMVRKVCASAYEGTYENGAKNEFILKGGKIVKANPCGVDAIIELPITK